MQLDARNRLSSITHQHIQNVLQKAKSGDQESVGELLGVYRDYLLGIAVARLDPRIRARCNPSDVVQETMLEAYRDFHQFRGGHEREFLAWIRQILANNLARMVEVHLLTDKRDLRRERRIEPLPNASGSRLENRDHWFTDNGSSPSSILQKKEQLSAVLERIARLPSNYRDVLILRHIEDLPFDEVGARLGKSAGAVRMLWLRALEQLREQV
ncbi:MAG: sigma-70 family RNA polymerase sigma factor [Pirellulaceae bacterium]|nr:sigma-70 family RNA polymerase sigma factor [Pirellulaceae bacterium]